MHEGGVDGGRAQGRRIGAWIMAHGFAKALDCSPWEGLLTAVRIAAGRVAYIELKLGTAWSDRQLEPPHEDSGEAGRVGEGGQNMNYWVKQAEIWHDKLVRVSKLAIDAGVAERMVRQLELEAQLMLRATHRMADDLGLDEDTRQRAISSIAGHLTRLEIEEARERDEDVAQL